MHNETQNEPRHLVRPVPCVGIAIHTLVSALWPIDCSGQDLLAHGSTDTTHGIFAHSIIDKTVPTGGVGLGKNYTLRLETHR
ncbi:MAG: hypothetical protein KI790_16165 [Cyclobacteriaceae bacterium]|nr:hypothetical protein [Cyclobacteriaceae bacterium HetDA_MAG_MS6]